MRGFVLTALFVASVFLSVDCSSLQAQAQLKGVQAISEVGAGWQFQKAISALQPMMQYSGRVKKGLYQYWDSSEANPPTYLDVDKNFNLADTPANIRAKMFNREDFFLRFLKKAGATYYHTLHLKKVRKNGGDALIHQFWYYFPTGEGRYFGSADQGFALVELEQTVPKDEAENRRLQGLVKKDLEAHRDKLVAMAAKASDGDKKSAFLKLKANIEGILTGPINVPINYYIEGLYTTSVMYPNSKEPLRVLKYNRDEVSWLKTRPKIYVAQGTHNLVANKKDFVSGDRCDSPCIVHPNLREAIVNVHNPHDKANPFPGTTNPHKLKFGGTFIEHPIYWLGARQYMQKIAAGEKLKAVEVRWGDGR